MILYIVVSGGELHRCAVRHTETEWFFDVEVLVKIRLSVEQVRLCAAQH
jgi:hypothetical protein